jgi:enoyl-[acyl-carrier protein] reductase/trans-2-enoyl-CoA reductase (NAD+)
MKASTGYGLANRNALGIGGKANTIGVFFQCSSEKDKLASPGWYISFNFKKLEEQYNLLVENINGNAV